MKKARMIIVLMIFSSMFGWVEAAVLNVPGTYPNIQAAIDGSSDGDIVVAASGIYTGLGNKNIDFGGRAITVKSKDGPKDCIIDCENDGRGFAFHNNEDSNSILDGFTVRNGYTSGSTPYSRYGAAIYCAYSGPIIRNCFFVSNRVEDYPNAHAGGIFYGHSEAQIKHCIFIDNSCPGYSANGGAILISGSSQILVFNCLFAGNSSDGGGGAIRTYVDCSVTAINCTFAYNLGDGYYGGAITNTDDSSVEFENCIFWGNNGYEIYNDRNSHALVTNCDIDGGWDGSGIRNSGGSTTTSGGGNINANPQFVSGPSGDYYLSQISAGQTSDSPCVDSGSDTSAALGLNMYSTRTDNITDAGVVDMGYHYPAANLVGFEITGPNEVAEESSAQYKAIAVYDNNSTKDVTNEASWSVVPDNCADIDETGLLSTYELMMPTEDVTIYAQYEEGNDIVQAEKDVQIFAVCPSGIALEFDGENDYVGIGNPASLNFEGEITIAAWIKSHSSEPWLENIVSHGFSPEPVREVFVRVHDGEYQLGSYIRNTPRSEVVYPIPAEDFNNWVHIVGLYDGSNWRLYRNGQLVSSQSATRGSITVPADWAIGARGDGEGRFFDGLIDEVMIFSRALSGDEIVSIMYNGSSAGPNMVSYWKFDESQGQVANDSSGNGNDGYLGSDPCEPDSADPCWVEPGASSHCTARQMIVRNLLGAVEHKENAKAEIDLALEEEKASEKLLLDEMKKQRPRYWNPWIMWTIVEVKKSILFEEQCGQKLQAAIESLERALDWLLNDTEPTCPAKPNKSVPGKCNK